MDTLYIKMCKKAIEIQKLAPKLPEVTSGSEKWNEIFMDIQGSVFWLPKDNELALLHWDNDEGKYIIGGYYSNLEGMIWLPRQDQLQKITKLSGRDCAFNYIGEIGRWIDKDVSYACGFDIMEQLWFAFVMKEKYGKIWNGEDWK